MKQEQQAILARDMIQMIRENADSSDILEYLESFAFSLARGLEDTSVVSWDDVAGVCDPFLEKMYWATKNGGAFENGLPLKVSSTKILNKALIGNSGRSSMVVDAPRFKAYLYAHCHRPVILHSFVYEAMLVASGKIAATVMTGSGAHDAASVKLIVEEAGGKVTDLFGEEQRYDRQIKGAIASNSSIHQEIVEIALRHRL